MNLFAVAIVSRRVAGKFLAIANHRAGAFLKLDVSAPGMLHALKKAHRPIMRIAVDVHKKPSQSDNISDIKTRPVPGQQCLTPSSRTATLPALPGVIART